MPAKQKKQKSAFVPVAVTTLALALGVTGLLLHTSIRNNNENLAKINELKQNQPSIVRYTEDQPQQGGHCVGPECNDVAPAVVPQTNPIPEPQEIQPEGGYEEIVPAYEHNNCSNGKCF